MKYSVLMPVYDGERAEFLRLSLDSLSAQSLRADQVIVVKDGPLESNLESVIESHTDALPITTVELEVRRGLGAALSAGLAACNNEIVARMDSDDICVPRRFEKQVAFLETNPRVAVVGAAIGEFIDDPDSITAVRRPPCESSQVRHFAKFRNPLNHMTVIFRKSAVLAAGGYRHFPGLEDYDLWVRMLLRNMEIRNLPDVLVLARCGSGMARRRGGISYVRSEIRLYRQFLELGFISAPEFAFSIVVRAPVRIVPTAIRPILYRALLREKAAP